MNIQKQPEIIDFERSNSTNCHEEISVNELASYLEFSTLIPRKMSSMAESIYGWLMIGWQILSKDFERIQMFKPSIFFNSFSFLIYLLVSLT